MSTRRRLLHAALALAAAPALGRAAPQPAAPKRIYMILVRPESSVEAAFYNYFRANGIAAEFIVRDVAQDLKRIPALIREARALKVDLIYTSGTAATLAVAGARGAVDPAIHVTDIPVVFTMVAAPQAAGLVDAKGLSGRNLTGASHVVPTGLQLEAMRAYRPLTRIGVIYNPSEPNSLFNVRELRAAAAVPAGRFELVERPVPIDLNGQPQVAALPDLVAQMARAKVQLLYMGSDSFIAANRKTVTDLALAQRLPTFAATESVLRDGKALFGLVSGYENVGRLTAYKAALILQGAAPGAIPAGPLSRFSYLVNMPVASALSFYPPLKVLNAAEIIK